MELLKTLLWPLVATLEFLLDSIHSAIHSYGLSIVILSVAVSLLLTPVTALARRLEAKDKARQQEMEPFIAEAKASLTGREQFEQIDAIYQRYGYHPVQSMVSLLPLLVQLPFLLAALFMLVDHPGLAGTGFLFIRDLGAPDGLLNIASAQINILPFALTAVAIVDSQLRLEATAAARRRFLIVSAVLLLLIYSFPAAVCLYWLTANSVSLSRSLLHRFASQESNYGESGNPVAGEALRYGIATALSAMLTLILPVIFKHALQLTPAYGVALTLVLVMAINFVTVRYFVFRSRAPALRQFTAFAASSVGFRLFEYAAFLLLYGAFGLHYLPALMLVLVVSFVAKFTVQRRFIFQKRV